MFAAFVDVMGIAKARPPSPAVQTDPSGLNSIYMVPSAVIGLMVVVTEIDPKSEMSSVSPVHPVLSDSGVVVRAKELGATRLTDTTTTNDFRYTGRDVATISSYLRSSGRGSVLRDIVGDVKLTDSTSINFRAEKTSNLAACFEG